jgi:hypothetical protein
MSEETNGVVDEVVDQNQQYEDSPASDESVQGNDYQDDQYDYQDDQVDTQGQQQEEDPNVVALREQNDMLRRQIELMQYTQAQGQQQEQDQYPQYDPDDLPTNRQVEEILNQKLQGIEKTSQERVREMQVQMAQQKYTDYDQVLKLADEVVGNNQELKNAIFASDNPAEVAYRMGQTHPNYLKMSQQKARADVTGKVKNNFNRPNTLSQAGGGKPSTQKDFSSMSKDEFEKEIHRIKMLGT